MMNKKFKEYKEKSRQQRIYVLTQSKIEWGVITNEN